MQNMMAMKKDLLQWFTGFLIKIPLVNKSGKGIVIKCQTTTCR